MLRAATNWMKLEAVLRETKAIKKAITCGEKEKQVSLRYKAKDLPVAGPHPTFSQAPFCARQDQVGCFHMLPDPEFREETGGSEA